MGNRIEHHDFYDDEFETLDNYGLKKGKVARIVKTSKKKGIVRKIHQADDLEEMSRKELLSMALENGLEANSRTGKKELIEALKKII